MQSIKLRLSVCVLAATLALTAPCFANDREAGPRGPRGDKSRIIRLITFVIQILDEFSIPPP